MKKLWPVYHPEIPEFLQEFAQTQPMTRLKNVGMNCGCEYTSFPRFAELEPYSRFDHSLGVALIVWHFTGDMAQSLAGLFHDVTTPVFAHVVDFLNGDHLRQESTEEGVAECLAASPEVMALLEKYRLSLEQVSDYHRYPVADNDAPALSADRLEYTLGNLLNYGTADLQQLRGFYEDLQVGTDEAGQPELIFRTAKKASDFAGKALEMSHIYVADEDRFAMEYLARLLSLALERGLLQRETLWTTEPVVIAVLEKDAVCGPLWQNFRGFSHMLRYEEQPAEDGWLCIGAKKRWIDPLALGRGRVSRWDALTRQQMEAFQTLDFSKWLKAE